MSVVESCVGDEIVKGAAGKKVLVGGVGETVGAGEVGAGDDYFSFVFCNAVELFHNFRNVVEMFKNVFCNDSIELIVFEWIGEDV